MGGGLRRQMTSQAGRAGGAQAAGGSGVKLREVAPVHEALRNSARLREAPWVREAPGGPAKLRKALRGSARPCEVRQLFEALCGTP